MTYRVFSHKVYARASWGGFVPKHNGRKRTIARGKTIEEARAICSDGPANKALGAGKEYRHLAFYEFERE